MDEVFLVLVLVAFVEAASEVGQDHLGVGVEQHKVVLAVVLVQNGRHWEVFVPEGSVLLVKGVAAPGGVFLHPGLLVLILLSNYLLLCIAKSNTFLMDSLFFF